MEIVRDFLLAGGRPVVRRFTPGELEIQGKHYTASVILTPERVIADWSPRAASEIERGHLETLIALDPLPETILIGTGEHQVFLPQTCLALLIEAHIGFEIMDTRAACRTWNILLSEDRRVAAALII